MVPLSWSGALAWRMRQQLLDPVGTESVAGVVGRLGAVPAQRDSAAELAIRTRRQRSRSGEVARALAEGRIIKTFAFRGATHLVTPEDGGVYLALRAASRMWDVLREDLEELAATPATTAVRLLPGYDQWVLGPSTAEARVVPPARRTLVSRQANIVIVGGVVCGTWSLTDDQAVTAWFTEAGPPPREALAEEVARLASVLERPLQSTVQMS